MNHTWSKALDDDQVQGSYGTFYGGNPVLDPNNLHNEYGRSDVDVRNRFVGTLLWKPQIIQNNVFMKHGLDGFTFSGTATEQTGFPIVAGMFTPGSVLKSNPPAADGNIYGGAISSGSGFPTTGRPPQIQRNSLPGPGIHNLDFRLTRDIPIHEKISMQIIGEAFNLTNHMIVTGVNSAYSALLYPTAAAGAACAAGNQVPDGSQFAGCITPYTPSSPAQAFGAPNSTNSILYGPRQLQLSAKLFF